MTQIITIIISECHDSYFGVLKFWIINLVLINFGMKIPTKNSLGKKMFYKQRHQFLRVSCSLLVALENNSDQIVSEYHIAWPP